MKFIGLSKLPDTELEALSHAMAAEHGEAARDVVNRLMDDANVAGDFVAHAKWADVAFGVLQILRPDPRWL